MRYLKSVFYVFLLISVVLISCQPLPPELLNSPGALTVMQMTTIKAEPNFNASDIATVSPDAQLVWIYSQGEWYRVRLHNGLEGWIHRSLVKTTTYKIGTIQERLELREQPFDGSAVTQILQPRTTIKILQESNEWVMIRPDDTNNVGWVSRADLNRAMPTGAVPTQSYQNSNTDTYQYSTANILLFVKDEANIRSGPSTNTTIVTRLTQNAQLGWNATIGEWYRITITSTGQDGYVYRPLVTNPPYTTISNTQECNLRAGPGTNYQQVDRIQPSTRLVLLYTYNDWYLIEKGTGELAWIYAPLTDYAGYGYEGSGTSYSADTREVTLISGNLNFGFYFTNKATNVYSSPVINSRLVGTLNAGQKIDVINMGQTSWYEIRYDNGQRGYIQKDDIVSITHKPVMTMSSVNYRQSPNTNAQIISRLKPGTLMLLTDVLQTWCQARYDRYDGWLAGVYVVPRKFRSLFVMKDDSRLYTSAQTSSPVIGTIQKGEEVYFYNKSQSFYQFKTYDEDVNAWIHESEVSVATYGYGVATNPTSIYQGPNTFYPAYNEKLPVGIDVPLIQHNLNWYQIMVPGKRQMGWVPANIIRTATMRPLIVLNSTPVFATNDERTIVEMLNPGTEVLEIVEDNAWHQVKIQDGAVGWIKAINVATTKYGKISVRGNTAVRYGPGKEYAIRTNISGNITAFVLDRQDDWVQIDYGMMSGWINSR